jgi:hypothetical protein
MTLKLNIRKLHVPPLIEWWSNALSCFQSQSFPAYWCWIVCLDICSSWMWQFFWFLVYCNMPNVREYFSAFNFWMPSPFSYFMSRDWQHFLSQASWRRWGFLHKSCSTIHRWQCPGCTGLTYFSTPLQN